MSALILVAPKTLPSSTPLRISMMVPNILLHYFDPSLDKNPSMADVVKQRVNIVSRELAQKAIYTCLGPVAITPRIREAYHFKRPFESGNDPWSLWIQIDCSVSGDEEDLPMVYFQAEKELDEDGNVRFVAVVPQTAKAKERYKMY